METYILGMSQKFCVLLIYIETYHKYAKKAKRLQNSIYDR